MSAPSPSSLDAPPAGALAPADGRQAPAPSKGSVGRLLGRALASDYWVLGLCAIYVVALLPFVPDLASPENLANVLSNMLPLLAVAIGQTFVLITGGIDLSVTAVIALASVTGATVAVGGDTAVVVVPLAVLAMAGVGVAAGLANGAAITRLSMPPFMVTLTLMMFGSGFAIWMTKSKAIHGLPTLFTEIGQGALGPVPYTLALVGALALFAHFLLTRTVFGRWLFAVGRNARAARVSGVPVERTILLAYMVSGVSAAIASVMYTARLETGSPVLGQRLFLDVIGAAVIGGTSLFGGRGSVLGTTFGVLFITLIDNSFNLLGLSSFVVLIAKGAVILAAALLDVVRNRRLRRAR